jgi:hypothetical protein
MRVRSLRRFCKRGHDTQLYGRTKKYACKECCRIHQRARYKKDKTKRNAYHRLRRYGVSVEQYNEMLVKQDGKCAICRREFKTLAVDHCHTTGRVRGLLCNNCNLILGLCYDDVNVLKAGIEYLNLL